MHKKALFPFIWHLLYIQCLFYVLPVIWLIQTDFDRLLYLKSRDAITFKNQNCIHTFRIDTSKSPHELVRLQTEFVATLNSIVLERLSKVLEVNISCQFISL